MIITSDDIKEIELKRKSFCEFEMKDLGKLLYFLGIEVLRSTKGILIHQRKYISDFLAYSGMVDCKPVETLLTVNYGLQVIEGTTQK